MEKPSDKSEGFFIGIPPFATTKDSCFFNYNGIFTATITAGGPTTYCIGDSVQLCSNNIAGALYSWNTGERTQCIYAHAGGVYSVIVSVPVDCQDTAEITITVDTTCCANGTEIDTVQNAVSYTGSYHLNHNARIARSKVTYDNLDLPIAAGKSIRVPSGDTLEINNSHLYACGDLWQGIIVEAGGKLIVDSSFIEDAITAIDDSANTFLSVTYSKFDNNLTDIYLHDGSFSSTVIKGDSFLYSKAADYDPSQPYTHIRIDSVTSTLAIGTSLTPGDGNYFEKKRYGIWATKCHQLNAYNNTFNYIGTEVATYPVRVIDGAGIYALGSLTANYGLTVMYQNYFKGCPIGVLTDRRINPLTVRYNNMANGGGFDSCGTGVYVFFCHNGSIDVQSNDFSNFDFGTQIFDMNKYAAITVSNNWFNCDASHNPLDYSSLARYASKAINIQSFTPDSIPCSVDDNIISGAHIGVHLRNIKGNKFNRVIIGDSTGTGNSVFYNGIPHPATWLTYGYWIENCNRAQVRNNSVINNTVPLASEVTRLRGYAVDDSPNSLFCSNLARNMGSGIRASNICQGTRFYENTMDSCHYGVNLVNAQLPDQGDIAYGWQNQWPGVHDTDIVGSTYNNNSFQITWYYDSLGCNDCYPVKKSAPSVIIIPSSSVVGCSPVPLINSNRRTEEFSYILTDTTLETTSRYLALQYFYEEASEDSTLLYLGASDDAQFIHVYDSLRSTNIGAFDVVKQYFLNENHEDGGEYNSGITPSNDIEENQKQVNDIYTAYRLNDNILDSDQEEQLYDIAVQSASIAGKAVYIARALLHLDVFEDGDTAYARMAQKNPKPLIQTFSGKVVPNPAHDQITYFYSMDKNQKASFEMQDITGRVILQLDIEGKDLNQTIPLAGLPSGVYYYRIITDHLVVDAGKIVLIK